MMTEDGLKEIIQRREARAKTKYVPFCSNPSQAFRPIKWGRFMKNRPQKEISSEETNEELGQKNAQVP
jgi:hypothetical protein